MWVDAVNMMAFALHLLCVRMHLLCMQDFSARLSQVRRVVLK